MFLTIIHSIIAVTRPTTNAVTTIRVSAFISIATMPKIQIAPVSRSAMPSDGGG